MPRTEFVTELYCNLCEQETTHRIVYQYDVIDEITCDSCGKTIKMNEKELRARFSANLMERILTKPHRLTEEFKTDVRAFIKSVPRRCITKPLKALEEIKDFQKSQKSQRKDP